MPNITNQLTTEGAGKVADPVGAAPRRVALQARNKQLENTETVKIRYGPYKIPGENTKNVMGEGGTLFNYPDVGVQKLVKESI
jgi:hypothetical protein